MYGCDREYQRRMRGKDTAVAGNESNVVFWHLSLPSLTLICTTRLCHRRHPHM